MNEAPRRIIDVLMTIVIASIALMILGQVLAQVLLQYMVHLIIAGAVVVIVWIVLRALLIKRMW